MTVLRFRIEHGLMFQFDVSARDTDEAVQRANSGLARLAEGSFAFDEFNAFELANASVGIKHLVVTVDWIENSIEHGALTDYLFATGKAAVLEFDVTAASAAEAVRTANDGLKKIRGCVFFLGEADDAPELGSTREFWIEKAIATEQDIVSS